MVLNIFFFNLHCDADEVGPDWPSAAGRTPRGCRTRRCWPPVPQSWRWRTAAPLSRPAPPRPSAEGADTGSRPTPEVTWRTWADVLTEEEQERSGEAPHREYSLYFHKMLNSVPTGSKAPKHPITHKNQNSRRKDGGWLAGSKLHPLHVQQCSLEVDPVISRSSNHH